MTNSNIPVFTDLFLDQVFNRFSTKGDLALYLQTELNLGISAAYKRINGNTPLTVEDIIKLAASLQISLDQFILPSYARITFVSDAMRKQPSNYSQYLENVNKTLANFSSKTGTSTTSIGKEIPLFHYANFPNLYHFKLYYWKQTFWNCGSPDQLFSLQSKEVDSCIHGMTTRVGQEYYSMPSTEIWTADLFTPILEQIVFFLNLDSFEFPNDALKLIDDLKKLSDLLQDFCRKGKKKYKGSDDIVSEIDVYYNELHDGTDCLLFNTSTMTYSFIKYDGPNFIRTQQKEFGNYTKDWIAKIINKSSGISAKDQRQRRLFFKKVNNKIQIAEDKVKYIIEGMK